MQILNIYPGNYIKEEKERISKYFSTNKSKLSGFSNKADFVDWYIGVLKENGLKCHYCDTSILEIRKLLNNNLINGRKVRGDGLRGPNFELDRKNPFGVYSQDNCVLSCYYCNNEKSNTFDYDTYKNIIGPAKQKAWNILLKKIST